MQLHHLRYDVVELCSLFTPTLTPLLVMNNSRPRIHHQSEQPSQPINTMQATAGPFGSNETFLSAPVSHGTCQPTSSSRARRGTVRYRTHVPGKKSSVTARRKASGPTIAAIQNGWLQRGCYVSNPNTFDRLQAPLDGSAISATREANEPASHCSGFIFEKRRRLPGQRQKQFATERAPRQPDDALRICVAHRNYDRVWRGWPSGTDWPFP